MIRPCALAVFILAAVLSSSAATAQPSKASQIVLQNGLQVIVVPDHRAPVVTQMLVYKAGAADDPPGLSGMAHFFQRMMFQGTKSLSALGFSQAIARNSGDDDAYTTHDYTVFYEQMPRDRLRAVMHLEADRMANLDLTDSGVAAERDAILAERRLRVDDDPQVLTQEQAAGALFLSHPYGRPVIGWPDEIRHIGRTEAENFYRRHYAPNNAILIVSGDITPDAVRSAAEAEYGSVSPHELAPRPDYGQPPRIGETRLQIASPNVTSSLFLRIYRVQSYAEAAPGHAEALEVLARLLGGDPSAALYRRLVLERRLAADISATYEGYTRDAGRFTIAAQPRPGVPLDALEHAIDDTISAYLRRPASKVELARAKTQLVAGATFRRDNQFEVASAYARALAVGLTVYDVQQWPSRIQAVTAKDVRDVAASSLLKRECVTAYLTSGR